MVKRSTVQDTAGEVLEAAEDTIGAFADKAYETGKAQAEQAVDEQKNAFKRFALTIVRALRLGSDELRSEGYATVAGMVEDVAGKAESMTDDIDDLDLRSATERVEDFVRERPIIAYGALAFGGFLIANALQTAARHRHERAQTPQTPAPRPASAAQRRATRRPRKNAG